jgi:hypothetical protein
MAVLAIPLYAFQDWLRKAGATKDVQGLLYIVIATPTILFTMGRVAASFRSLVPARQKSESGAN